MERECVWWGAIFVGHGATCRARCPVLSLCGIVWRRACPMRAPVPARGSGQPAGPQRVCSDAATAESGGGAASALDPDSAASRERGRPYVVSPPSLCVQ